MGQVLHGSATTTYAVCDATGQLLDSFTPQECANYLENAGYASSQKQNALGTGVPHDEALSPGRAGK